MNDIKTTIMWIISAITMPIVTIPLFIVMVILKVWTKNYNVDIEV